MTFWLAFLRVQPPLCRCTVYNVHSIWHLGLQLMKKSNTINMFIMMAQLHLLNLQINTQTDPSCCSCWDHLTLCHCTTWIFHWSAAWRSCLSQASFLDLVIWAATTICPVLAFFTIPFLVNNFRNSRNIFHILAALGKYMYRKTICWQHCRPEGGG